MFKSIRWRFTVIYFTLVFVALMIVGLFIIERLKDTQLNSMEKEMMNTVATMVSSSKDFTSTDWNKNKDNIQKLLDEWNVNSNYRIYIVSKEEMPKIIASANVNTIVLDEPALKNSDMMPDMILSSMDGERREITIQSQNKNLSEMHITYPVIDTNGEVKGIFYTIGNLENINRLLSDSTKILVSALLVALGITLVLGFFLSKTITKPIAELKKNVLNISEGDYSKKVEVKSDDEIGQLASMFNSLTDKLDSSISEIELERAKLNTIFEYMQEGVIALNSDDVLIHANQVATEILHISKDRIKNIKLNLNKLNIFNIDYKDKDTLAGVSFITIEDRHYNLVYGPYVDDSGKPSGLIIVFQDVTEEHRLDEMRKDFVANVSHELKTPLTTIKTYTETLLENEMDRYTSKNFLKVVNNEADRMDRIVRDLLQLSHIDNATVKFEIESINLHEFIKNCMGSLEVLRKEKNLYVDYKNPHKDLIVQNDRGALEKIFINILSNAYKYSNNFGDVEISVSEDKDNFSILVKDNGIGIPYSDQKHIFERFYRVEKARSRKAGGTGLGLSIARELTDLMNGKLIINSKPNVGTEVVMTFKKELVVNK